MGKLISIIVPIYKVENYLIRWQRHIKLLEMQIKWDILIEYFIIILSEVTVLWVGNL